MKVTVLKHSIVAFTLSAGSGLVQAYDMVLAGRADDTRQQHIVALLPNSGATLTESVRLPDFNTKGPTDCFGRESGRQLRAGHE